MNTSVLVEPDTDLREVTPTSETPISTSSTDTTTPDTQALIPSSTCSSPDTTEEGEEDLNENHSLSLERDHPSFENATLSLIIQLLPNDHHADGRLALIAVKSHNLPPLTMMHRLGPLTTFPSPCQNLLHQWSQALPHAITDRLAQRAKAREDARVKDAERKAQRTAAKRSEVKRPDKTKPSMTTASASSSPVTSPPTAPAAAPQAQLF